MRKTANIDTIVDEANTQLQLGTQGPAARQGVIALLETILHGAGRYAGFRYLEAGEVPRECAPGIRTLETGMYPEDYAERFAGTDETRRSYFKA